MCVSLPARVVEVDRGRGAATVDVDGARRTVSLVVLDFDGRAVRPGDWVLVHTGFAVSVLEPRHAADLAELHRRARAAVTAGTTVPTEEASS